MTDAALVEARRRAIRAVLGGRPCAPHAPAEAFAPANIALVKYWGKRDDVLNLPRTSSLSVSLGALGTHTRIAAAERDAVVLNGRALAASDAFAIRLSAYLDLFRHPQCPGFRVDTRNLLPTAAGLASSASGFAALARALDGLFQWGLDARGLSVLARLGSGSACRSLWTGFVEWQAGTAADGSDSHGVPLAERWPELRLGLAVVEPGPKPVGSREAMRRTVETSPLYAAWPATVARDLDELRAAIRTHDFERLGRTAEGNALAMHATMQAARPPVVYWTAATLELFARLAELRRSGAPVYFTMDAGPNVKLLFGAAAEPDVARTFPGMPVVAPFAD